MLLAVTDDHWSNEQLVASSSSIHIFCGSYYLDDLLDQVVYFVHFFYESAKPLTKLYNQSGSIPIVIVSKAMSQQFISLDL